MKIHIIGCSGSGKTYLAKHLSGKFNIPRFDLDDIYWDNTADFYGVKTPVDKRSSMFKGILKNDNWIIEGVYYSWVGQSFNDSDIIYVLDIPEYLYKYRIILRFIKRKLGIEKGKKETFKSVIDLLKWTDKFQNKNMKEIKHILENYGDKVVLLSNRRDVNKIIGSRS